ncbi:substrate-binding domain-containing protein [sulfur-oxidizing endosymbiont of Gigantopelta aegis]|uniref:substrate-binding domain-containing protein n=1 Tax=sulfur-oxidizing endosymbiont of Gigantopelta aegis TaxID=2794934 RepID=UPI0018DDE4F9|nr:substrate-binding domain-containing protein [sulfur-oxidizing endosymbiont of Gigantopelta aegis]
MKTPSYKLLVPAFFILFTSNLYAKTALVTENPATATKKVAEDVPVKKIIWTGCGITKKAFMAEIAKAYEKKYGVTIELKGGGATNGIRKTKAGESHLGGTCRLPLHNRAEESQLLKLILVAWDALVVIVHKDAPIDDIKQQELIDVLEGKIAYWNELSGWKGKSDDMVKIDIFTRGSKISGVGYTLRKILFNDTDKVFSSTKEFPSSGPLEKGIEKNINSFGVTGISSARKRNVKVLNLNGIKPDYETIKTGNYVMYRPLYLTYSSIYRLPKNEKKEVRRFLEFIKSDEAAKIIKANGVVPFKDGFHLVRKRKDIFGN